MPGKKKYSYDSECLYLAEHFLFGENGVSEADKEDLAQDIQNAVEDWFFYRESQREAAR